jgi:hypothetical protein
MFFDATPRTGTRIFALKFQTMRMGGDMYVLFFLVLADAN